MTMLMVRITVPFERQKELLQTIRLLADPIRNEDGCISHRWYQDLEDRNAFLLTEEWNCGESLTRHLRSERFGILLGAMKTLGDSERVSFAIASDELDVELGEGLARQGKAPMMCWEEGPTGTSP